MKTEIKMVLCRAVCMLTNSTSITTKSLLNLVRLHGASQSVNIVKNQRFFSITNTVFSGK